MIPSEIRTRILATFAVALLALVALSVRLFQIQVPQSPLPQRNPHLKRITLHRERGAIRDRNGNRLAFSVPAMGVVADARKLDPEGAGDAARRLGPLLGIPPEELAAKLGSGRGYESLAHRIDPEVADQIRKLRIPGISFEQEYRRFYPNGSMASSLLGFVGQDDKGLEGLEFRYEDALSAVAGEKVVLQTLRGFDLPGGVLEVKPASGAADVYLTIDEIVQHLAEKELDEIERLYQPRSAFLMVTNPQTGEILAWGVRPGFDPNAYQAYPEDSWRNRMVTDFFEPGSTLKIITAAAALEDRVLETETVFECPGWVKLWGHAIGCTGVHGTVTLPDIIAKSCNTGIIKVGQVLGPKNLYYYLRKFGFGEPTGLPHPAETPGILRFPEKWSGLSIGAISMGQEVAVTAVQMATAIGVIANGGNLVRPRVISRVMAREGARIDDTPEVEVRHRVISPETARLVREMMGEVVVRGTGRRGRLDTWQAAGKTGTSQKLGSNLKEGDKFIASFVGFLPVKDPKALIYIVINEPKGKRTEIDGGLIAAPAFRRLAPKIMIYLDVPPDEPEVGAAAAAPANRPADPGIAPAPGVPGARASAAPELPGSMLPSQAPPSSVALRDPPPFAPENPTGADALYGAAGADPIGELLSARTGLSAPAPWTPDGELPGGRVP